jgi:hypothetical protein
MRNTAGIARLEAFCGADPDRYLPLTDSALRLAAKLWAQARNARMAAADPRELDADVLIAAQASDLGVPAAELWSLLRTWATCRASWPRICGRTPRPDGAPP